MRSVVQAKLLAIPIEIFIIIFCGVFNSSSQIPIIVSPVKSLMKMMSQSISAELSKDNSLSGVGLVFRAVEDCFMGMEYVGKSIRLIGNWI